jgi:hypothetical protein
MNILAYSTDEMFAKILLALFFVWHNYSKRDSQV